MRAYPDRVSVEISPWLDFIKFGTGHDSGFWATPDVAFGTFPSTVQYLAARGKDEITSIELTDENVQAVFSGAFGDFGAIVVSESIQTLSSSSYALFQQYVLSGGCFILTGSHGEEDDFLNNAFGFNTSVVFLTDGVDSFVIQPDAAGTAFAGGPGGLIAANASVAFINNPGLNIYSGPLGVTAFTDTYGEGDITALGWDYCCTPPNDENAILAWYEVINRAFDQCDGTVGTLTRPIPTISEWGLISMAGILGLFGLFAALKRRKAAA
jgi:hypothetical protein